MQTVNVKINETKAYSYPILIEHGLLNNPYTLIGQYTKNEHFFVVTNEKVFSLYGEYFKSQFAEFIVLPDGEEYKNQEILSSIIDKLVSLKAERKDAIIALGGGVIGDMAGFAAAVYKRGIDFIQVPTTLLAQVDSSVGGKVAVNHKYGKNLIGAFYQPKLVIADINTINTLDERQFKTGLSEVLKYAFIEKTCQGEENYNFLEFLEKNKEAVLNRNPQILEQIVKICCSLKSAIVNQDEKEKGLRAILNFGHTFAHAIEMLTDYIHYTHGEAVSIGMKLVFDLAKDMGKIDSEYHNRAVNLIKDYGLITQSDVVFDKEKFYEVMKSDKKVSSGNINFVLPTGEAQVEIISNIDKKLVLRGI